MILYYSGTHNTRFVAQSLAELLGDACEFIPHLDARTIKFVGREVLILAFPVYSWGVPPIVLDFIARLPEEFTDNIRKRGIPVIVICTAGDEVARTPEMIEKYLAKRGLPLTAIWSVIMPNDYVLLPGFDVDSEALVERKQNDAKKRVRAIASKIISQEWEHDVVVGSLPGLKTALIYPLFVRWGIKPERWKASDQCIGCGQCRSVCPVGNINMNNNRPEWSRKCISCTACYQVCPVRAISYGGFTKGKGQYFCRLRPLQKINK